MRKLEYVSTLSAIVLLFTFYTHAGVDGTGPEKSGFGQSNSDSVFVGEINIGAIGAMADVVDLEGITYKVDNCVAVASSIERGTDGKDIGNICDEDLNNDCIVQCADLSVMESVLL